MTKFWSFDVSIYNAFKTLYYRKKIAEKKMQNVLLSMNIYWMNSGTFTDVETFYAYVQLNL